MVAETVSPIGCAGAPARVSPRAQMVAQTTSLFGSVSVYQRPDGFKYAEKETRADIFLRSMDKCCDGECMREDPVHEAAVLVLLDQARADATAQRAAAEAAGDARLASRLAAVSAGLALLPRLEACGDDAFSPFYGIRIAHGRLVVRTEFAGEEACAFVDRTVPTPSVSEKVYQDLRLALEALHWCGFSHSDVNIENVCITPERGGAPVRAELIDLAQAFVHPKSPYFVRSLVVYDEIYSAFAGRRPRPGAPVHTDKAEALRRALAQPGDECGTSFPGAARQGHAFLVGKAYALPRCLITSGQARLLDVYALDFYALAVTMLVITTQQKPLERAKIYGSTREIDVLVHAAEARLRDTASPPPRGHRRLLAGEWLRSEIERCAKWDETI